MNNKTKLKQLLEQRIQSPTRQVIQPVNFYEPNASKPTSQKNTKEINIIESNDENIQRNQTDNNQTTLPVNQQTIIEAKRDTSNTDIINTSKIENQQNIKPLKKFASYLTRESLKSIKRIALEEEKHDYEVLQEAVDEFLENYRKRENEK